MMWQQRRAERRAAKKPAVDRRVIRVTAPGKSAALVFDNGVCVEAPERLSGAVGKSPFEITDYCKRRGWKVE